jgi:sialate O-acetylesterase
LNWRSLLLSALLPAAAASAQVSLPKVLSDHMVLQRDLPVHVSGRAVPGESVSVTFRDEARTVTTTRLGR